MSADPPPSAVQSALNASTNTTFKERYLVSRLSALEAAVRDVRRAAHRVAYVLGAEAAFLKALAEGAR